MPDPTTHDHRCTECRSPIDLGCRRTDCKDRICVNRYYAHGDGA